MSENTVNAALRVLGFAQEEMSAHGFRAMAATLLNESGGFHPDAIERQLAHVERDGVRRAYTRGEYWNERVTMMQFWRSEEHTSELQSLMRISYAVLCLKKKTNNIQYYIFTNLNLKHP